MIRRVDGEPSYLDSYLWWRAWAENEKSLVGRLFDRYSYKFDQPFYCLLKSVDRAVCPLCDGWGEVEIHSERVRCLCEVDRWRAIWSEKFERYQSACLPAEFSDFELDKTTPTLSQALAQVEQWVKQPDKWLALVGTWGNGKTMLLRAIWTYFRPVALYLTASDFEKKLFGALDDGQLGDFLGVLGTAPILLFDDWGQEYGGKFSMAKHFSFVDERYRLAQERITVVASNLTHQEFLTFSRAAGSRIVDSAITLRLQITDRDRRL